MKLIVIPSLFSSFNLIGHRKFEIHEVCYTVFTDTLTKKLDVDGPYVSLLVWFKSRCKMHKTKTRPKFEILSIGLGTPLVIRFSIGSIIVNKIFLGGSFEELGN